MILNNGQHKIFTLFIALLISGIAFAQVENVPQTSAVYTFLKEMKAKRVIPYFNEDVPNLSRFEVKALLDTVREKYSELSSTEKSLLLRYEIEFSDNLTDSKTTRLFTPGRAFLSTAGEIFSDKVKYLYTYQEENANVYIEGLGHFYHGQRLKHGINNANLYDIGFRIRGTVFKHLGYYFYALKGGVSGNKELAEIIEPRLKINFKWIEAAENIGNYDFAEGYIKYHGEPAEGMHLSVQLGREPLTVGYGYSSKLVLSGDNPVMDFLQFNFDYGIVHFTSIHASTVGIFSRNRNDRYTKYWAFNRLKFSLNNLFDIGIGESIVYSGRGLELGYLTPVVFYKFVEMSLQDRDNGNLYFDLQTNFIKNLQIQATFFLDENILSHLDNFDLYTNKTAYQVGAFWYEAFTLSDLSFFLEYTKIRPYVYSHFDVKNTYSAWGVNLGHPIGPNADELFTKLAYNLNDWVRFTMEYRHRRSGENIYDENGNLIKNVGGDMFLTHGGNPENKEAFFLDGSRINTDIFQAGIRIEPIRDFIFDIIYNYSIEDHITKGFKEDYSYGLIKFTLEY